MSPMSPSRRLPIFMGERETSLFNRFSAKAIDLIIVLGLFLLGRTLWAPLGVIIGGGFCALQDGFGAGQSVGKRIIGLCVIDAGVGYACSFRASFLRNLPFVAGICFLSPPLLWILLFAGAVPIIVLEVYLLMSLATGVRVGDILGNTRVVEYIDANLPEFRIE